MTRNGGSLVVGNREGGTDTMRGARREGVRVVFGSPGAGRGGAEERRGPLVIRCGSGLPITQ